MKNEPLELLHLLALSEKRCKVLLLLREGPKTLEDIRVSTKKTSSGLLPQIRKLENAGLVYQEGRLYGLTGLGEVLAQAYSKFYKSLIVIGENIEFWKEHRIEGIPESFRKRISELGRCKILETSPSNFFEPHEEFMEKLIESKKIMGLTPIFHPDFPATLLTLAISGKKGSFIVTREVYEKVKKDYEEELQSFLRFKNIDLLVCDEDIEVAFTTTDLFLSLGLFLNNSRYDLQTYLICYDKSAINWGEDLFNYYKDRSVHISSL